MIITQDGEYLVVKITDELYDGVEFKFTPSSAKAVELNGRFFIEFDYEMVSSHKETDDLKLHIQFVMSHLFNKILKGEADGKNNTNEFDK